MCFGLVSCAPTERKPHYSEIEIVESEEIKYSSALKSEMLSDVKRAMLKIYTELGGKGALPKRFETAALEFFSVCEERRVTDGDFREICKLFCDNTELFAKIGSDGEKNGGLNLFAKTSNILGSDRTSRMFYDVSLIYCNFMRNKYLELYEYSSSKPEHFLCEASEWEARRERMKKVGEDNFVCVLKLAVSGPATFSDENDFLLDSSEICAYLNAQGELMSRITTDSSDLEFLIEFFGETGVAPVLSAISEAGAAQGFALKLCDVIGILSKHLMSIDADSANRLKINGTEAFICHIAKRLTSEEKAVIEAFLSSQGNSEKYISYFRAIKADTAFTEFCESSVYISAEELWASEDDVFFENFKNYFASVSPAVAFAVFEL